MGKNAPLMLLLKAFERKEWAETFLDGCLYCNTLSFHRKKDKQEGAVVIAGSSLSRHKIELGVRGGQKRELESIASLTFRPNIANHINVFCMFSWTPPFIDDERILVDKESQLGSLRTLEDTYGPYTVFLKRIPEFVRRLRSAVDSAGTTAWIDLVKYNLYDKLPTTWEEAMELAFHKNPKYSCEKEYRIALIPGQEEPGPFRLEIGSIRDIAVRARTKELYDSIKINGSSDF